MENLETVKVSKKELLRAANEKLEKLEKELTQEKSYKEMYSRLNSEKENEIEEIHNLLDGIEGVISKEKDSYNKNKLVTRVVSLVLVLSKK